ncbi:VWA domain-containing protein [Patulibacter sp. SYSU D01012]|uniref:VWA domain-containing protein n=1 Tax=Patulibacter sp. SYSU D01012 TaxID=2817381 RepID=UPI001B309576|nr:VWA domain-containing protein [Patulibacter sp. SYSU D01012]
MAPVRFPFTALVGQDDLRRALLINAVAPEVGGVLVRGERGTAKTTAVRALEALLPPVAVIAGDPYGAAPAEADRSPSPEARAFVADGRMARARAGEEDVPGVLVRPASLVELPVGASVDRVLGTLDLERALRDGDAVLQPGLLARAHRGILYVDEVNLLGDHLVDVLLDAAAQGEAVVERDAVSVRHPARFMLVGTMNPEEGDLRPQLLDRFGLSVTVAGSTDPATRAEVVRRRLAFEADPAAFAARWADEEARVAADIAAATERLPGVRLPERMLRLITGACARLGVDGMRADLVAARCARAIAALEGRDEVAEQDVQDALLLTLPHRRRRGPLDPPGLEPDELDRALDEARGDEPEEPAGAPDDDGDGPDDDGPGPGAGGAPQGPPPAGGDAPPPPPSGPPPAPGPRGDAAGAADHAPTADAPEPPNDADDEAPAPAEERGAQPPAAAGDELPFRPGAQARERTDAPGGGGAGTGVGALLQLARGTGGVAGRRGRTAGDHGQPVDVRAHRGGDDELALPATLRAAALRRAAAGTPAGDRLRVLRDDHRAPVRAGREGTLVVFCVDASGSMGARRRMSAVKDAALGLLMDAYQRRDRVALVTFRGTGAQVVLPPTGSVERAADRLARLATGGGTPLAAGLDAAGTLLDAHRRRDPARRTLCVVVTDGRASGGKAGLAAAERAAEGLGRRADGVVVFDSEQGRVRLGLAARIADAAGARLLPVSVLTGEPARGARRAAAAVAA